MEFIQMIRQQKDILGSYASHFLSDYICIYSGYGSLKSGIQREVADALRPGVHALIDICSNSPSDDLQKLHEVLGVSLETTVHDTPDTHHRTCWTESAIESGGMGRRSGGVDGSG
ncbi:hypothetical protein QJS10_CPB15g00498 [Acorus calamus]|uniref:Nucleolar 27S pre-rRNA processing Urb2/Npa2 C-terminal domain-containing protein n=1 Tax=Acorus calamus TaxID=4465 RepID=A0AAV9D765_ACOCL|nr:hypothetical protein QJS10_CPB15g00498 [Acorus calamus]